MAVGDGRQRKCGVGDKVKCRRNLSRRNGRFFSKSAKKVKRMVGVMGVGVMGDFQISENFPKVEKWSA